MGNDYRNLGMLLHFQDKHEPALAYMDKALSIFEEAKSSPSGGVGYIGSQKGMVLLRMGRLDEAYQLTRSGLHIAATHAPPEGNYTLADTRLMHGRVLMRMDSLDQAVGLIESALEFRKSTLPSDHPGISEASAVLGLLFAKKGDIKRAKSLLEPHINNLESSGGTHPQLVRDIREVLESLEYTVE